MQWSGLAVLLAPGTNYAWTFGIAADSTCDDWEPLATAANWPYSGGQACSIVNAGGPGSVTYPSVANQYDAVFGIGLSERAPVSSVVVTDIGTNAPTAGAEDISQFVANSADVPGLNWYWDNGSAVGVSPGSPPAFIGQTFTTGTNPPGYVLTSVAFQTYCCGKGGSGAGCSYLQSQAFTLNIYQISGTNLTDATLLNSFTATGQLQAGGDWMRWSGLAVPLAPGTNYAWTFGISTNSTCDNWEPLATAAGWPYTGGQACAIVDAGGSGSVFYSSETNQYDAVFDIGLSLPATLKIARAAAKQLTVTWPEGTLLQSAKLAGPWTTNTATSPYTFAPTNSQVFFRVR
jgi:hypothetical protein